MYISPGSSEVDTEKTSRADFVPHDDDPYVPLPDHEYSDLQADIVRSQLAEKTRRSQLAEASRPWCQLLDGRKRKPCGRKRTKPIQRSVRFNWFNGIIWDQIHGAVVQANWNPTQAIKLLMTWNPNTFKFLHTWVLSRWMERVNGIRKARLATGTLARVAPGRPLPQNNRAGILDSPRYGMVKEKIIDQLKAIGATGCRITVLGAKAIIIAYVQIHAPELFSETKWRVSDQWTRQFLRNTLRSSIRKGTTAAQKLPQGWETDARKVAIQLAYLIRIHDIPSFFILNMDETGVLLQPGGDVTYHEIGARDVPITGAEDKRQFTLLCTVAMSGHLLPFGSLWRGATKLSLPKRVPEDEFFELAEAQGHKFFTAGEKHWSTVKTMMQWVLEIVLPYRAGILVDYPQFQNTPVILYLDVYWCHRCNDFLNWLESSRSQTGCKFIVLFVLANTTSVCQPCDVGLQRPIKHELRRQHMETAILETSMQLQQGIKPENVKLDVSLPHLRNQTPRWLVNTFLVVQKTNAGKHSWERSCKTGIFDLSYKTLTSWEVWEYIRDVLPKEDPAFWKILYLPESTDTIRPITKNRCVVVEAVGLMEPGGPIPAVALEYEQELVLAIEALALGQPIPPEMVDYERQASAWDDGTELPTDHLIQLYHDLPVDDTDFVVGVAENGSYYSSHLEEDTDFGHVEGISEPAIMDVGFIMN